jgi:hypothetical protein
MSRPTPFGLVFGDVAQERFPALRDGALAGGRDPGSRDEFVLVREVAELLREIRPEEGLGEAVEALVAFVHTAFLFWRDGERVFDVSREELGQAIAVGQAAGGPEAPVKVTSYIQLPSLVVWGVPIVGNPPEPLDGWFLSCYGERLTVLAVFGLRPGREAMTTVEISGPRPPRPLARIDGTPLFAPRLTGGEAAQLYAVEGEEELLELAWRLRERARANESGLQQGRPE